MWADSPYAVVPAFNDSEAKHMCLLSADQTNSTRLRIPGSAVHGQVPWFLTNADATDESLETQGKILFGAGVSSSEQIIFMMRCDVEFKTLLDPTIIAALARSRAVSSMTDSRNNLLSIPEQETEIDEKFSEDDVSLLRRIRAAKRDRDIA
jgi:hypothetical protein